MTEQRVYSQGGYHRFHLDDRVTWWGRRGRVVALSTQPSVTVEFDEGDRLSVGQGALTPEETR